MSTASDGVEENDGLREVERILNYGTEMKKTLYVKFLKKINAGEQLTPTDQRTFLNIDRELRGVLGQLNAGDIRMGYDDSAAYLKLSKRSVSYHVQAGHLQMHPDGGFLKSELDRYRASKGQPVAPDGATEDPVILKERADLTYKQARATREEFLMKQLSSQYALVSEVHQAWGNRVKELATSLTNWQNGLAPLLENKTKREASAILARECRFLLERYSRTGKWTPVLNMENQEGTI